MCVLAGMVHTEDAMITSVASIEAHGCALVHTYVMDAHGPLTHCTGSAGTRQAKNVVMIETIAKMPGFDMAAMLGAV